jgi:hypothetical protein
VSILVAFYLGMSLALTASYYARIWDEAGEDERKQKSAIRKAVFFPYFLLAMPVLAFPGIKRRLEAFHAIIFDEGEEMREEPLTTEEMRKMIDEERPKMLAEVEKERKE